MNQTNRTVMKKIESAGAKALERGLGEGLRDPKLFKKNVSVVKH